MTRRKRGLVAGILFLAVALTLVAYVAGPFEDANNALESGDYATVLKLLHPLAIQGNAEAQLKLGILYATGQGVERDYVAAVKWYRLSAEQGYAEAQFALGVMYHSDLGVALDDVQALMWFTLAASGFPPGAEHDRVAEGWKTLAEQMTPAQVAEAEKLARESKPRGE